MKENEKALQKADDFLGSPEEGFEWVFSHPSSLLGMGKDEVKTITFRQVRKKKVININVILNAGIDVELSDTKDFNCCNISRGRSVITADRMYSGFDYCRARVGFIFCREGAGHYEIEGLKLRVVVINIANGGEAATTYYEVMGPADGWIYAHEVER